MKEKLSPGTTKNLKRGAVAAVAVAAITAGGVALADGPRGRGGPGFGKLMRVVKHLDLTEEQEVKMVRIRHQMRSEMESSRSARTEMMKTAAVELGKANPEAQKLHGLADKAVQHMSTKLHLMIDKFLELHATFTPEQRTKLSNKLQKVADRKGRKRGKRGKRGQD